MPPRTTRPDEPADTHALPAWITRFRAQLDDTRALTTADRQQSLAFRPVAESVLVAFERAQGVTLPAEYRDFVLHVGIGGGPNYGLVAVDLLMPDTLPTVTTTITSTDGTITASASTGPRPATPGAPALSRPFAFTTTRWNVGAPLPLPADAHPYDGCLYLADQGCGYFDFLVVTGPRAGEVWSDDSAAMEGGGIARVTTTFRAWMEAWLSQQLASCIVSAASASIDRATRSKHHARIVRWESLQTTHDPWNLSCRATLDLYLGRRDEALAALAKLEADDTGGYATLLRRRLYRDELVDAAGKSVTKLTALAAHPVAEVRRAVARNAATPPSLLARFGDDVDPQVRLALARHPSTPWATLEQVFHTARAQWERAHIDHAALLPELEAIVRHPEATPAIADALATFEAGAIGPWALRAAALSHAAADGTLRRLSTHAQAVVRHAVGLNPKAPGDVVDALARDAHFAVRLAVAARPDLPSTLLAKLARDRHPEVRTMVAYHPNATASMLTALAEDTEYEVLIAVLRADALPAAVREALKRHPQKPTALATSLFGCWKYLGNSRRSLRLDTTSAEAMAEAVYSHPAFPESLLVSHFEEQYNMGGYASASHPFLAPWTIARLARDPYDYTRAIIARRDDVPAELRESLSQDKSAMVREAVRAARGR